MLKICGSRDLPEGRLVVDDYVPFSFRAYERAIFGRFLCEIGDLKASLFELRIDKGSGVVYGVTLVLYNQDFGDRLPPDYGTAQTIQGLPIVERGELGFAGDISRQPCDFRLVRGPDNYIAVLRDSIHAERCYKSGRVGFFEGHGELSGIGFFDLTPAEMEKLVALFQRLRPQAKL